MTEAAPPDRGQAPTVIAGASVSNLPSHIGPYRVLGEIGRGGMGAVLRAVRDDDQLKKHVALKLIRKGLDTDDLLTRFRVEKQVLSSLNHPNIARVLDAGQAEDGRPYFVMEYIEGQPITEYCDTQQLSTQERLELFRKVCSAVHAAHQNLIVHRDIKPSNILVTAQGEPKLLDFGIAKLLNADLMGEAMGTLPGERLMTPEYASPEQVQGLPITTASDVYSLGVLLYQVLTGRQPYQLKTRLHDELVRIVCEMEPERPSTAVTRAAEVTTREGTTRTMTAEEIARRHAAPASKLKRTLSGDLDNVVLRAMRKSPRRRYASAQELGDDLLNHLEGRPVKARPETWVYFLSKFVQRNRAGVAAAGVVVVAISAGGLAAAWSAGEAREQQRQRIAAEAEAASRLAQLREFAASFLPALNSSLQRLDGATTAQLLLASTSVKVLDQLAAEPAGLNDAALQGSLARGYRALGNVRGGVRGGSQQDTAEALACYEKAHAAWGRAGQAAALVGADLIEWCELQLDFAVLEGRRRGHDAAMQRLDAVAQALPRLAGLREDFGAQRIEPWVLLTRSDVLMETKRVEEGLKALDETIQKRRELCTRFEDRAEAKRDLAIALRRRALHFEEQSQDYDRALGAAQEALLLCEQLAAENEKNTSYQRDLALTRGYASELWTVKGEFAKALPLEAKAAAAYRLLAARDPDNARASRDEWYSLGKLMYLQLRCADLAGAQATGVEYHAAAERWNAGAKSKDGREALAAQMRDVGLAAMQLGSADAARRCLRYSVELCRKHGLQPPEYDLAGVEAALSKLESGPQR
jgi:serine/threonine protein kinase